MTEPKRFLLTMDRAIDKTFTGVGEVIYALLSIAVVVIAKIVLLPVLEGAFYFGTVALLVAGIVFGTGMLILKGWKRL